MVFNILIFVFGSLAILSGFLVIYYHLAYQKACRNHLIRAYLLELLDQKKAAHMIIATITFSLFLILAVYKQNNLGG